MLLHRLEFADARLLAIPDVVANNGFIHVIPPLTPTRTTRSRSRSSSRSSPNSHAQRQPASTPAPTGTTLVDIAINTRRWVHWSMLSLPPIGKIRQVLMVDRVLCWHPTMRHFSRLQSCRRYDGVVLLQLQEEILLSVDSWSSLVVLRLGGRHDDCHDNWCRRDGGHTLITMAHDGAVASWKRPMSRPRMVSHTLSDVLLPSYFSRTIMDVARVATNLGIFNYGG
jgi:hypothetical protein